MDEDLSSTFATVEIPVDILLSGGGGGGEGKRSSGISEMEKSGGGFVEEYNSSSSSSSRASMGFDDDDGDNVYDEYDDEGMLVRTGTTSSRSSISSLPGSVVVHPRDSMVKGGQRFYDGVYEDGCVGAGEGFTKFIPRVRDKRSPFRHPSSVRAMQMNDGDDESVITPSRYGKRGNIGTPRISEISGVSVTSQQSSASSRYRRSPNNQSPTKQNVKKEYPLVLLHCNLLSPSLSLPAGIRVPHPRVLKDVLPHRYWRRWKLLEDKIIGSGVLQDRGVLISHPQEAYDLLEERLLESLELVTPRLDNGHFLGGEEDDEDEELEDDVRNSEAGSAHPAGHECPDCGTKVVRDLEGSGRKWEIKVYAANGLMKAGAWTAAWREMEKVDVEVRVWLPEEVRRDLENRIIEDDALQMEEELRESEQDRRRREIYGSSVNESQIHFDADIGRNEYKPTRSTTRLDASFGEADIPQHAREEFTAPSPPEQETAGPSRYAQKKPAPEVDLQTLLFNYFRILARDSRNVIIGFLGVLVLFLAVSMNGKPTVSTADTMLHEVPDVVVPPASSTAQYAPPVQSSIPQAETVEPAVQEPPVIEVPESEDTQQDSVPEASVETEPTSQGDAQASPAPAPPVDETHVSPQGDTGPSAPDPMVDEPLVSAVSEDPIEELSVAEDEDEPAPQELDDTPEDEHMEVPPEIIEEQVVNEIQEEIPQNHEDD